MLSLQVLYLMCVIIILAGNLVAAQGKGGKKGPHGKPGAAKKPTRKLTDDEKIDKWLNSTYFRSQDYGCIAAIDATTDEDSRIGTYASCDPLLDNGIKEIDKSLSPVPLKCCNAVKHNNLKPPKDDIGAQYGINPLNNVLYGAQKQGDCVMANLQKNAAFLCKCIEANKSCNGTVVTTCCSPFLSCNPITKTCRKDCAPKGTSCLHNGVFDVTCCSGKCKTDLSKGGECE